jgi:hypothetical protein
MQDLLLESSDFTSFLLQLAIFSASRFSGRDPVLCSLTVEGPNGPVTVASSDERASRMDEIQYGFNEGPCLLALRSGETVLSRRLSADQRWPRYGHAVAGSGLRSALCVAVATDPGSRAAVNCYAEDPDYFTAGQQVELEAFARTMSGTLRLAMRANATATAGRTGIAVLDSRAMVDAAISLIMLNTRMGRDAALALTLEAATLGEYTMQDTARAILNGWEPPGTRP